MNILLKCKCIVKEKRIMGQYLKLASPRIEVACMPHINTLIMLWLFWEEDKAGYTIEIKRERKGRERG